MADALQWVVHPDLREGKKVGFMLVLGKPDARGLGWTRQLRAWGETKESDGLTQEEASKIADALNAAPVTT